MNFVSLNGKLNSKASKLCSSPYEIDQHCYEDITMCQKLGYFATYWKRRDYVKFWKNKKIQQKIVSQKGDQIQSVVLNGSLQAVFSDRYLRIYFNKKKLVSKCLNRNFIDQITFTNDSQIILKKQTEYIITHWSEDGESYHAERGLNRTVQLYDFISKNFTNCGVESSCDNTYEYSAINNIILIPSGQNRTNLLLVWGVSEKKVINQLVIQWPLFECEVKMTETGQYFVIRDFRLYNLYIFSYGKAISLVRKISNLQIQLNKTWNIQWILGHQYFLINKLDEYKILENNNQITDCKLQKYAGGQGGFKNTSNKIIINVKQIQKKNIYIILKKRGQFVDYYSIII